MRRPASRIENETRVGVAFVLIVVGIGIPFAIVVSETVARGWMTFGNRITERS
jgi:hypothetical protein